MLYVQLKSSPKNTKPTLNLFENDSLISTLTLSENDIECANILLKTIGLAAVFWQKRPWGYESKLEKL